VGEIAPQWNRETVILGYASLSREQIVEGLRRLEEAWRER
jgi:DNA-binding transcriptional MocR family regulator